MYKLINTIESPAMKRAMEIHNLNEVYELLVIYYQRDFIGREPS